jgi:hypothetical protein
MNSLCEYYPEGVEELAKALGVLGLDIGEPDRAKITSAYMNSLDIFERRLIDLHYGVERIHEGDKRKCYDFTTISDKIGIGRESLKNKKEKALRKMKRSIENLASMDSESEGVMA